MARQQTDAKWGARMRRVRGARSAHRSIRASGRVPGEEARAKVIANREARRREQELAELHGPGWRVGRTDLDGI